MTVLHSYSPGTPDPDDGGVEGVVRGWWAAWQRRDLETVEALASEEYMEYTGHLDRHRVGKLALMAVARETFERFEITRWSLSDFQSLRPTEELAVIGYGWELVARWGDGEVRYSGVATDVLVRTRTGWRYLSHHSSQLTREHG
ncbi:MAG: nuclear transport factor 2 family protein [Gemmatimonadota bacterium]